MKLTSPAFEEGAEIPVEYTCDGGDFSPPLHFDEVPEEAQSLSLIMDDPDAPGGTWDHWVVYNIPPMAPGLAEKVPLQEEHPSGLRQGLNSWERIGWGGPCPPDKRHRYFFKLYALNAALDLPPGAGKNALLEAMDGKIIAEAQLMGTYDKIK